MLGASWLYKGFAYRNVLVLCFKFSKTTSLSKYLAVVTIDDFMWGEIEPLWNDFTQDDKPPMWLFFPWYFTFFQCSIWHYVGWIFPHIKLPFASHVERFPDKSKEISDLIQYKLKHAQISQNIIPNLINLYKSLIHPFPRKISTSQNWYEVWNNKRFQSK